MSQKTTRFESFTQRHLGPSAAARAEMLKAVGAASLPARLVEAAQALASRSIYLLSGTVTAQTERVQFTVCSMSRSEAQVAAKWLGDRVRSSPGRQSVGSATIFQWNIEDETGSAEVLGDGSDEAVRTVDVDLIGTFKEA